MLGVICGCILLWSVAISSQVTTIDGCQCFGEPDVCYEVFTYEGIIIMCTWFYTFLYKKLRSLYHIWLWGICWVPVYNVLYDV